jgi:hypothetical protein
MDHRPCGHEPWNHVTLVGHLNPLTLGSNLAVNLLIFSGMRPDKYSVFWKCFFERWYELLKVPKDSLFMIPQPFGILKSHAPSCLSEPGFFPLLFHWLAFT